jgi:hypothetical protein
VYVEFLIAFFPILTFFLGLVQFGFLVAAKLCLEHSAYTAARAASVVLYDNPAFYDGQPRGAVSGKRHDAIAYAAALPMVASGDFETMSVKVLKADTGAPLKDDANGEDSTANLVEPQNLDLNARGRVVVSGLFHCRLPLASTFVCGVGFFGNYVGLPLRHMYAEANFTVQGVRYPAPSLP